MVSTKPEQVYVAEMLVPSLFWSEKEKRQLIDNPVRYEINKGYYAIHPIYEMSEYGGYSKFSLIFELVSKDLKSAEDHALKVARTFSSMASAYGGYPYQSPFLRRLARLRFNGEMDAQFDYFYRANPFSVIDFNNQVDHEIRQFFQSFSSLEERQRHRLQSALHWYAIGLRAVDPTVSYVAAWTGLECIGTEIDRLAHPSGSKARCQTCQNNPGEDRDRKKAGIDHMIKSLTNESLSEALSEEARESLEKDFQHRLTEAEAGGLRNFIVHGLYDIDSLYSKSSTARRFLLHVLNACIQILLGQNIKSLLPGEYDLHPDARYSVQFQSGLCRSPFHGEWVVELEVEPQSAEDTGQKITDFTEVKIRLQERFNMYIQSIKEEVFKQDVEVYFPDQESHDSEMVSWTERPAEPDWEQ